MNELFGLKIAYSTNAVEKIILKRSWKERLLTFPWRPWQKTRVYLKPCIYQIGNAYFLVHPSLKNVLHTSLKGGEG